LSYPRIAPRLRPLAWLAACFLVISTLTRIALRIAAGAGAWNGMAGEVRMFATGFGYDVLTFVYFAWPLVLLLWLLPRGWLAKRRARWSVEALCFVLLAVLLFVGVAEWTFWDEFQARFNFIAVDYLVYTTEVLGNIRQSYPVATIFSALGVAAIAIAWTTRGGRWMHGDRMPFAQRSIVVGAWLFMTIAGTWFVDGGMKDRGTNSYADELAGNGIYQFFAAYRNASLDYDRYYRTVPGNDALAQVRKALATPDATFLSAQGIDRHIHNARPERKLNVVLVSVESLSADFSGTYGNPESLTPNLDALTRDSLVFTHLYASGTRTVRGLEALSLSVPPTPGESIVKRPGNAGLFSLAEVFNAKGYDSEFLYGGYGAFDEMNAFFAGNGYGVHDRTEIPDAQIHHENVWGVADEDLYTLALSRFDKAHAAGKPFFAHLMTTSNHRPYTFPEGRGPWPQKQRNSAVLYTDWAIGDFLRRARKHEWFKDTVFVFTADHCASSAGKAALPAFRYRIPLWVYAPGQVAPGTFDGLMGQIDIAPTVLGLLGMDYDSRFYGVDVFEHAPDRAFVGTYQLLGYLQPDRLVQLAPHRQVSSLQPAMRADLLQPAIADAPAATLQAISFYETAAHAFRDGGMRRLEREPDLRERGVRETKHETVDAVQAASTEAPDPKAAG
jgi:phosphoglycerol transferase MdoB-like AlkP superfamily enzyme